MSGIQRRVVYASISRRSLAESRGQSADLLGGGVSAFGCTQHSHSKRKRVSSYLDDDVMSEVKFGVVYIAGQAAVVAFDAL